MILDRVIHFGETLGDQEKGRSPKKLKFLIEVPYVVQLKVRVLSFNMNNVFLCRVFIDHKLSISEKNLGYQVKRPLTIKQKLLIEVPCVLKRRNILF